MNPTEKPSPLSGTEEMKMLAHLDLDIEELEQRLELAPLMLNTCGVDCATNICRTNGCTGNCASNVGCSSHCGIHCGCNGDCGTNCCPSHGAC